MPVSLTPRPQPGDIITADWMARLADAIGELYTQTEGLSRRLALLEQGGGRRVPELVSVNPDKFKNFVEEIRGGNLMLLNEPDKSKRIDKAREMWLERRQDVLLDDDLKSSQELTEQEWVLLGTAVGIKPSDVPRVLATKYPSSSRAVVTEMGDSIYELDNFANLTEGKIGFR